MNEYSIAVIIPAYNAESFISHALDSILEQERRPDQVIVVDDGSTDRTADLVNAWSIAHNFRIDIIQQRNKGPASARNTGIKAAHCDLIALLDADDVFLPFHLKRLEKGFEQYPNLALCFGDAIILENGVSPQRGFLKHSPLPSLRYEELAGGLRLIHDPIYISLLRGSYIPCCSTLFSKNIAKQIGFFDENIKSSEDRDFWMRLSRVGKFGYYSESLARVRRHENNITHYKNIKLHQTYSLIVLNKMIHIHHQLNLNKLEIKETYCVRDMQIKDILYTSSLEGIHSYINTCYTFCRSGISAFLWYPKNIVRAILKTFSLLKN